MKSRQQTQHGTKQKQNKVLSFLHYSSSSLWLQIASYSEVKHVTSAPLHCVHLSHMTNLAIKEAGNDSHCFEQICVVPNILLLWEMRCWGQPLVSAVNILVAFSFFVPLSFPWAQNFNKELIRTPSLIRNIYLTLLLAKPTFYSRG